MTASDDSVHDRGDGDANATPSREIDDPGKSLIPAPARHPEPRQPENPESEAQYIPPSRPASLGARLNRAFGPVVAGIILDVLDLATFGPIGLLAGIPVGAAAGYWMGSALGLPRGQCIFCAIAGAVYCTIPFTEVLPLATLVGAYARFRGFGSSPPPPPDPPSDLD